MNRFNQLDLGDEEAQDRPQEVEEVLRRGKGLPARNAQTYLEEADAAYHRCDFEAALRGYSRLLEEDNTLVGGWFGQVCMLNELGEFREADIWAGKALEMFPEHPLLLAARSIATCRAALIEKALEQSDYAVTRPGLTGYVWRARAEVLLAARRAMYATCLDKAILQTREQRAQAWMHWELARMLRRYGKHGPALKHAEIAANALTSEAGAWLELGLCEREAGIARGRETLERAFELDPQCLAARRALKAWRKPSLLRRLLGGLRR